MSNLNLKITPRKEEETNLSIRVTPRLVVQEEEPKPDRYSFRLVNGTYHAHKSEGGQSFVIVKALTNVRLVVTREGAAVTGQDERGVYSSCEVTEDQVEALIKLCLMVPEWLLPDLPKRGL